MENSTADVTATEKSPDEIEREMEFTRESITEKVSLLENQVLGNIQSVTSGVTEAVQSVKEAVATAPTAVSETVKQTIESVKETVQDTVGSFSLTGCIRDNPGAALGTTAAAGFLAGYFLGGHHIGSLFARPLMAQGHDAPAPQGRTLTERTEYNPVATSPSSTRVEPAHSGSGLLGGLWGMFGGEIRQLAEQAMSRAVESLKQSINQQVPQLMDATVQRIVGRISTAMENSDTSQHGGRGYAAPSPSGRI